MARAEAGLHGGEEAGRPWEFSPRSWKQVLFRVKDEIGRDNLSIVAAGVAFYALFAIFPGITALVTVYGLITNPVELESQLVPLQQLLPADAFRIVQDQTHSVVTQATGSLSLALILSLVLAVWSATKGVKAMFTALNIAYEEQEERGFFSLNLYALAFTVGGILFVIIALALIAAVPAALSFFGEHGLLGQIALALRWVVMALLTMAALAVVYRYAPSRATARMQWVSVGAAAATFLWIAGSVGFSLYVSNFGSYDKTFGSLGAVVVLLMWFYLSAYVVCIGAELNAELERQTRADSTTGPPKPIGERGAFVADNKPATT
jgi:membrane protein